MNPPLRHWSYENQNTLVEQPSGDRVTFTYNGDKMQVAREDADEARRFEWDKQNLLLETDDLGTPLARYTHEPDEYGRLVSREDLTTSEPAYYHYDALGSTAALSDQSEVVGGAG